MTTRSFRSCLLFVLLAITSATTLAGTLNYQYDALGRPEEVQHPDGSVVSYTLDPAGNLTEVATRMPPGIPASITVLASSTTGSYSIEWGAACGTLTAYELYEAANAGFSGEVLVSSGTSLSQALSCRFADTKISLPSADQARLSWSNGPSVSWRGVPPSAGTTKTWPKASGR